MTKETLCQYCEHRQVETGYQNHKPTVIDYCELNNRYPVTQCDDYSPNRDIEEGIEY